MDISKLSRHTKQAKQLIVNALDLNKLEFEKTKRVTLNENDPLQTIKNILPGKTINEKEIKAELVIRNICGENGAAKKLANSMLKKSKKQDGFKKLAEELEKIKLEDVLRGLETEKIKKIENYISNKKRGKEGRNGKDAREIDFLKLLCAALVLEAINQLKKNETPKESLPASELETGSVDDARKDEQAQKQTGLNVKLIRTVGNVENMEAKDLRYVISEDETELIIYPNFAGNNILLKYVANHLYRIAGENESHYPDGNNTFPAQKTYRIGKYDKDKLNNIKQANEKGWISNWENFKKKGLDRFIHSLGADGNFSDQWLTYGEAIKMTEKGWNEILVKRAKEEAKKKAEEARKKDEAEEKARKEAAEAERLRKEEETEAKKKAEEARKKAEAEEEAKKKAEEARKKAEAEEEAKKKAEEAKKKAEEKARKEEEDKKKAEEERLRKEAEERNKASDIITSAQYLAQPKELSDTEKLINDNIEKIKKLSMHFNQTFHCHFNEEGFDAGTFAKHLLKSNFDQRYINYYIKKSISYYYINGSEELYSETKLSTLIDNFVKCMRGSNSDYTIKIAKFIVAICVPGITFPSSGQNVAAIDDKLNEITKILFNKIPPGNTNQELSNKLKEIEQYGSELKKEYSDYYRSYRSFLTIYNKAVKSTREVTAHGMSFQAMGALTSNISRPVPEAVSSARKCFEKMPKEFEKADKKVKELLDDCAKLGVDITNTNIFVLSELKELIDKYKKLKTNGVDEYITNAIQSFNAFGGPQNLSCYTDPDIE